MEGVKAPLWHQQKISGELICWNKTDDLAIFGSTIYLAQKLKAAYSNQKNAVLMLYVLSGKLKAH